MKVIALPINVVAVFDDNGTPTPLKLKLRNPDESERVIRVDAVLLVERQKIAGKSIFRFRCRSIVSGVEQVYEITYELLTMKWILFKM